MAPRQKRKFPAQGVGRGAVVGAPSSPAGLQGHSSLPLKPGIPGKLLPKDTDAIVLAGGKDGEGPGFYSNSKKSYSAVVNTEPSSPPPNRNESAMSHQQSVSSPNHAHQAHHPIIATSPPTKPATGYTNVPAYQSPRQRATIPTVSAESSDFSHHQDRQNSPPQQVPMHSGAPFSNGSGPNGSHHDGTFSNGNRSDVAEQTYSQHSSFPPQQPHFYDNPQMNSFQPSRDFPHHAGHEMPLPNTHYAPFRPPPSGPHPSHGHHHHHFQPQSQHQHQPVFYPPQYPFPGNITPPNTGSLLPPPPPFQPHGPVETSGHTSEVGSSTNPQTPFTPTHSYDLPPPPPHGNPLAYGPPPALTQLFHHDQLEQEQKHRREGSSSSKPEFSSALRPRQSSVIDQNPRLRKISFIAADCDPQQVLSIGQADGFSRFSASSDGQGFGEAKETKRSHPGLDRSPAPTDSNSSNIAAAQRLQSHALSYFLSDALADVDLILKHTQNGHEVARKFKAHSFILARSTKLYGLFEGAAKKADIAKASSKLSRTSSMTSWADEMEIEDQGEGKYPCEEHSVPDSKLTVLLESDDKYVSQDSFILAFRSLYGASDWDLEAFLDPMHPQHRTLEWTRGSTETSKGPDGTVPDAPRVHGQSSLQNGVGSAKGEEVRMLERSIELFATGTLLGVEEVVNKARWGIRRWGLQLQGGAIERLLEFITEDSGTEDSSENPMRRHGELKDQLLEEAVGFLAECLPAGFKPDNKAPASEFLVRFPKSLSQLPKPTSESLLSSSPAPEAKSGAERQKEVYSTILLSLPFSILKSVLEHERFTKGNFDWKARYDIAKAVVQERERRRKRSFRASQGLPVGKAVGVSRSGDMPWTGEAEENEGSQPEVADADTAREKEGSEWESLYWEESVLYAFGHGGRGENCTQLTRRRKGVPSGRILWKAGDSEKISE